MAPGMRLFHQFYTCNSDLSTKLLEPAEQHRKAMRLCNTMQNAAKPAPLLILHPPCSVWLVENWTVSSSRPHLISHVRDVSPKSKRLYLQMKSEKQEFPAWPVIGTKDKWLSLYVRMCTTYTRPGWKLGRHFPIPPPPVDLSAELK